MCGRRHDQDERACIQARAGEGRDAEADQHGPAPGAHVRARRSQRGQAITEFALVLPVMLTLLLLATDFGRLFFTYVAVNNAAREATQYASVHAADSSYSLTTYKSGIVAAAMREADAQAQGGEGGLTVGNPSCYSPATDSFLDCHTASNFAGGIGNQVTVAVAQPFTFITPLIGSLFGGSLTLRASATAPVLNPPDATVLPGPSIPPLPTATPTSAPTPSPTSTPAPTPTPPPGATPTPTSAPTATPSPTPLPMCTVPDFFNTYFHDPSAEYTWREVAKFTGSLTDATGGKKIKRQTLVAGSKLLCSSSMTLDDK
jgi:Flp pilus assembly protein TadG